MPGNIRPGGPVSFKEGGMLFRYALSFILFVLLPSLVQAEDYCSLIVMVFDSEAQEVPKGNVWVTVEETNGRAYKKGYDRGGTSFCGLGISSVTVTVSSVGLDCVQTSVRNIPLEWGTTKRIAVLYNYEACMGGRGWPPPPSCQFVFRFEDSEGKPINHVMLNVKTPYTKDHKSDSYGRVETGIGFGKVLEGVATASGFSPTTVRAECDPPRKVDREQIITMTKAE